MKLTTILGALTALAVLGTAAIGVQTKLEENRAAASKAYKDGLSATEKTYQALNERVIGVEARLDVLMHAALHTVPAPLPAPPIPRKMASSGIAMDVETLAGYAAKRRASAPAFKALMEQKR